MIKKTYIEITNVCNLECAFCPKTTRQAKFMTVEEFDFITNQTSAYSEYVNLHVMGEPMLHPNFKEILDICDSKGLKTNITTNGMLLGKMADVILHSTSVNRIAVSMHSFEANNQNITLDMYLDTIFKFTLPASEKGIYISLRLWNLDGVLSGDNSLNSEIIDKLQNFYRPDFDILSEIQHRPNITLIKNVFLQLAEKFQWPDLSEEYHDEKGFCYGLRDHFAILCDGSVVPCCLDHNGDITLGNIFETNLKDILECDRAKGIYDGFSKRNRTEELCKKCGYIDKF